MKLTRETRAFAEREAAERGLSASWHFGSKHPVLTLSRNGKRRSFTVSGSPRTPNTKNWLRQDIRRIDRDLR